MAKTEDLKLHCYRLRHKSGQTGDWVVVVDVGDGIVAEVTEPDGTHHQFEGQAFEIHAWAQREKLEVEREERTIQLPA